MSTSTTRTPQEPPEGESRRPEGLGARKKRRIDELAEAGAVASVGSTGDSYDNALAEAFNSLFKAELIRNKGPFTSIEDLEIAVAEYVDWFNHRRVHGEIGMVPPVEFEDVYHHENPVPAPAGTALTSL